MLTTKQKGRLTVAKILARLIHVGKHVLIPFDGVGKYDLLVDNFDGTFTRIECKTGRLINGVIVANAQSCGGYNGLKGTVKYKKAEGYHGHADMFAIWCEKTDTVYLVPVEQAPKINLRLRVAERPIAGGPESKWAKDFEI